MLGIGRMLDRASIVDAMLEAAVMAGDRILAVASDALATEQKSDLSPVTVADRAADAAIAEILSAKVPGIPIVSEENVASQAAAPAGPYFLCDPLDGTRGFIEGSEEYTVNIALIEGTAPTLGVILVPRWRELYWVDASGAAMTMRGNQATAIEARVSPQDGMVAVVSRTNRSDETEAFLSRLPIARTILASSSLKFCQVASGLADVYPRFAPTSEWDTAAGDAILRAAGGSVRDPEGRLITYGKPGWANRAFIARGKSAPAES
jgi:3'(2'), 5'-bisphosphate nucleotidase